jgi:hypothetical protein
VANLIDALGHRLAPAEVLNLVCEAAASHLSLVNVVFFKRIAGQTRVLGWSAPGASTASRLGARERVWSSVAAAMDEESAAGRLRIEGDEDGKTATSSVWNDRLGLSALLHVESHRRLDDGDVALLDEVLRHLLGAADPTPA